MLMKKRLTLSQKMSRLGVRLRDPEWRRYGGLLLTGKGLGVALLIAGVAFLPDLIGLNAFAADGDVKAADVVNPINTVWTLLAAFLVFAMQVGFTWRKAGSGRCRGRLTFLWNALLTPGFCVCLFSLSDLVSCSAT